MKKKIFLILFRIISIILLIYAFFMLFNWYSENSENQDLYNHLLERIKEKYLDNNLIDDKINDYVIQMLNDIFNYYLYGNKEIPIDI